VSGGLGQQAVLSWRLVRGQARHSAQGGFCSFAPFLYSRQGRGINDLRQVTLGGGKAPGRSQHPEPAGGAGLGRGQGRSYRGQRVGLYRVNRVEIGKGEDRQLVYYWFQEQGRALINEYLVKLFIVSDALTRNRTDGALVRQTTVLKPGEDWTQADGRLRDLAGNVGG
jgi:hypothetical protein